MKNGEIWVFSPFTLEALQQNWHSKASIPHLTWKGRQNVGWQMAEKVVWAKRIQKEIFTKY